MSDLKRIKKIQPSATSDVYEITPARLHNGYYITPPTVSANDTIVTLATDQNISGTKKFTNGFKVGNVNGGWKLYQNGSGFTRLASGDTDIYQFGNYLFWPVTDASVDLGGEENQWKDLYLSGIAYTSKLNNGADIIVPSISGTLALTSQLPTVNNATLTIKANGTSKGTFTANASSDVDINITAADLGLDSAMKFIGTTTSDISDGSTTNPIVINSSNVTAMNGNVVLYSNKEYIWNGSSWEEFGDESSFALKTRSITGTGVLGGGGTLEADRTITHNEVLGTAKTTAGNYKIKIDKYGHISEATAQAILDSVGGLASNKTGFVKLTNGTASIDENTHIFDIASYDVSTGLDDPVAYLSDITLNNSPGSATTRYLHASTDTFLKGVKIDGTSDVGSGTHTHSYTAAGSVSLGSNTTSTDGVEYIEGITLPSYNTSDKVSTSKSTHTHKITPSGSVSASGGTLPSLSVDTTSTDALSRFVYEYTVSGGTSNGSANAFTGISSTKPTFSGTKTNSLVTAVSVSNQGTVTMSGTRFESGTGDSYRRNLTITAANSGIAVNTTKGDYTPEGSVTLNANNFTTTSVVTGVTAASGTPTYKYAHWSAGNFPTTYTFSGTEGTTGTTTDNADVLKSFSAGSKTTKYFHPTFTGTSNQNTGTPSATTTVMTGVAANGTASAITGLSANSSSSTGDITYLQSYSVSGSTVSSKTQKYLDVVEETVEA